MRGISPLTGDHRLQSLWCVQMQLFQPRHSAHEATQQSAFVATNSWMSVWCFCALNLQYTERCKPYTLLQKKASVCPHTLSEEKRMLTLLFGSKAVLMGPSRPHVWDQLQDTTETKLMI